MTEAAIQTVETGNEAAASVIETESADSGGYTPLFDEEAISDSELRGEKPATETAETDSKEGDKPEEKETVSEPGAKETEEGASKTETKETQDDPTKPPAGYVPHQALAEERAKRKEIGQKLATLEAEVAALKGSKPAEKAPAAPAGTDFKVLSKEEFQELLEGDPVEAIKYQQEYFDYRERQKEQEQAAATEHGIIQASLDRVRKAVPQLYEEGSDVGSKLTDFALAQGFDANHLGALVNPRTKIIPAGSDKPILLGEGAAALVEVLHKFQRTAANPEQLKAEIEKGLRETITKEVTEQLLEKFKKAGSADSFRTLGDGAGAGDETPGTREFTEAEYAKMSPAERRRLLGG